MLAQPPLEADHERRLAISNRRLIAADDGGVSFRWKDYRIEGPGCWKTMTITPHEFDARIAQGLPSHPSLWAVRQRQPRRRHLKAERSLGRDGSGPFP
jgi:Putative transposase